MSSMDGLFVFLTIERWLLITGGACKQMSVVVCRECSDLFREGPTPSYIVRWLGYNWEEWVPPLGVDIPARRLGALLVAFHLIAKLGLVRLASRLAWPWSCSPFPWQHIAWVWLRNARLGRPRWTSLFRWRSQHPSRGSGGRASLPRSW
jgi:hypothetical protein